MNTDSEKTDTTKTGLFELYSDMGTTYYDTLSAEEELHLEQEEIDFNEDFSKEDNKEKQ